MLSKFTRLRARVIALVVPALVPALVSAQALRDSVVSASATRTTRIAANRAHFYLLIEGTAETPADAIARAELKGKAVLEALKRLGNRVSFDAPMNYTVGAAALLNGYQTNMPTPPNNLARQIIRVQLDRPNELSMIIASALTAGASGISTLAFEYTAADSVRRARVADALASARQEAKAIADALGGRLGVLFSVNINAQPNFQPQPMLTFDNRFGQQSPAPDVLISATVSVSYRLTK
jgi:uncharacterized protein YggE